MVKFDPSTRKAPLVRPKKRCGRRRRVVVVAGVKPDKNNIVYVSTGRISYPGRSRLTSASAEDRAATRPNEPFGLKSRFAAQNAASRREKAASRREKAASRPCRASHGPFGPAHRFAMLGARFAREKWPLRGLNSDFSDFGAKITPKNNGFEAKETEKNVNFQKNVFTPLKVIHRPVEPQSFNQ